MVHIWDCGAGGLRELASVAVESSGYDEAVGQDGSPESPAVAWHPHEPQLMVAGEGRVVQWSPAGPAELNGPPPTACYRSLAFSPDGRTLWATPSSGDEDSPWDSSDVLNLLSGTVSSGPRWDTGIVEHPGGGLVATLRSDQGATYVLFAQVDHEAAPGAVMRVLRRALILDVDGYEPPVFSADGRHFAVRGNAYDNSLEVFAFPSLRRVLATTLGEPSPGYPYPQEWLDRMRAWSRQNIAFGAQPGVLWVGTPTGTLIEVDLETEAAAVHDVPAGSPVSGLGTTAAGELVVAGAGGDLVLLSVRGDSPKTQGPDPDTAKAAVAAFLDATSEVPEVPDGDDLENHLVVTDGTRTWDSDDLATVTTATAADPTWLRLQAAINTARDQGN
ncbi:hypothetical protein [Streptomyces xylophagus]|uniref:hypothetical protein n=1 Tax=Streptomyces xylophagus TaxID=285514 RepID=UPI000A698BBD|nr:hypothetical protein [Streptomyces xylophagus]